MAVEQFDVADFTQVVADDDISDYGSEFSPEEETILGGLLLRTDPHSDNPNQDPDIEQSNFDDVDRVPEIRIPLYPFLNEVSGISISEPSSASIQPASAAKTRLDQKGGESAYPVAEPEKRDERERSAAIEEPVKLPSDVPDLRSPLERFRTKPKKPFSVTDLISPSWCELQYWYGLMTGKRRTTPAMKRGTSVHKVLEEQVHTTVMVDNSAWVKEDALGLRIWNIIQGLRTLRETGMTREFEVWGFIDGLLVNGCIDELSTRCRDEQLQAKVDAGTKQPLPLSEGQTTITDFLGGNTLESAASFIVRTYKPGPTKRRVYITDVKTRGVKSLPRGPAFRPTELQLMIYHRLLSDLATGKVDPDAMFERYDLDGDATFSDSFVTQIGSLNESFDSASQQLSQQSSAPESASQDSLSVLLAHNSLRSLWSLMMQNFTEAFPRGVDSIGKVLAAEYRDSDQGEIIGVKTILYDENLVDRYLASELRWWRGERAPEGVCVEEAYKCGMCDFAEGCSWRKNKIEDAVLKMRERKRSQI